MVRLLTLLIGLSVLIGSAQARGLENVDDYIRAIRERAAAGEFMEIGMALDPDGVFGEQFYRQVATFVSNVSESGPLSTDILFRDKSTETGERIIFTVWSGHSYLFFAVIFHRRSDGWMPIEISVNTDIEALMHYF